MNRTIRLAIVFATACYIVCTPLSALATNESPIRAPATLPSLLINRVVAGISGKSSYEYIELYNPNSHDVVLSSWRITVLRKDGSDGKQEFVLNGTVKANGYVLLAGADSELDSFQPDLRLKTSSSVITTVGGIVQLSDGAGSLVEQLRWGDTADPSPSPLTGTMLERVYTEGVPSVSGDATQDFISKPVFGSPRSGGYTADIAVTNQCEGVKISEIAANVADDAQFVELYNGTNSSLTLDGCLLQTNRSTTKNFMLAGVLNPGEYKTLFIAASELTLTKTTTGTVYLLSSDGEEETDVRSYDSLQEGTSWSWFDEGETWRQTFTPTPGNANIWQEFLPCEGGYERNEDTGRCRKIVVVEAVAECAPGQYRSSETNRCRSTTLASTPAACRVGQYRNPETNRCRALASATSNLTPCREGQERNPDTNRCRNVSASIPEAAFGVEPVAEARKAFVGWWALGGVGTLAASYGAWEWRREMLGGIRKFGTFFTSSK